MPNKPIEPIGFQVVLLANAHIGGKVFAQTSDDDIPTQHAEQNHAQAKWHHKIFRTQNLRRRHRNINRHRNHDTDAHPDQRQRILVLARIGKVAGARHTVDHNFEDNPDEIDDGGNIHKH